MMTPEQFIKFQETMRKQTQESVRELAQSAAISIEKNVGKDIRELGEKLNNYIQDDIRWKEKDQEWKGLAQPTVNLGKNAISLWGILKWVFFTGITFSGFLMAIQTIKELLKK